MKINNSEWYPIYLQPTGKEIQELGESGWDTVRILSFDKNPYNGLPSNNDSICIASGFGNTHETLAKALKAHFNLKRGLWTTSSILFFVEDKRALFDMADCGGGERTRASIAFKRFFTLYETSVLKLVIESRGLFLV